VRRKVRKRPGAQYNPPGAAAPLQLFEGIISLAAALLRARGRKACLARLGRSGKGGGGNRRHHLPGPSLRYAGGFVCRIPQATFR
jgi:hypothetical protein